MKSTPKIPDEFRQYVPSSAPPDERTSNWRNIYELCPSETRFYGTESLYGDWDGLLLLLAQDFSSVAEMERRKHNGDQRPFRHDGTIKTNINLQQVVNRTECGVLYGSALAGLLRNWGEGISGPIRDKKRVLPYGRRATEWVITQMPNLKGVACLGLVPREVIDQLADLLTSRGVQRFDIRKPAWQWSMDWDETKNWWADMCKCLGIHYE